MESDLFSITAGICGSDLGPFTTDNNPITIGRCWRQGWEEVKTPSFPPRERCRKGRERGETRMGTDPLSVNQSETPFISLL